MPKWMAYTLLLLFAVVMTRPVMPYLSYSLHKNYIAEVLCENRSAPELQCNGACHLRKLVKAADPETPGPVPVPMGMEEMAPFEPQAGMHLATTRVHKLFGDKSFALPEDSAPVAMEKPPQGIA